MIDLDSVKLEKSKLSKFFIPTNLDCFAAHKGLRPGEVTTVVGPRGGGKSTFSKTIMADVLSAGKKIMTLLSEEESSKYLIPVVQTMGALSPQAPHHFNDNEGGLSSFCDRLKVVSELSMDESYKKSFWSALEFDIDDFQPDVFIYDNYTTGFMAQKPLQYQYDCMLALRRLAAKKDIPIIVVLHTDKKTKINERPLSSEDVRGLSSIVNIGSYNYVIQPHMEGDMRLNFLIIDKARYHPEADKTIWELKYNPAFGIFQKATKIKRTDFISLFQKKKEKKSEF